jgi:hypothetical protein
LGIGVFLGLVLTIGIGSVIYSQPSRNFVSDLAVRVEGYSARGRNYLFDIATTADQQGRQLLSGAAVKAADYSQQSRNYLSARAATLGGYLQQTRQLFDDMALKIGNYFRQSWNYLSQPPAKIKDQIKPTSRTSADKPADGRLADSRDVSPTKFNPPAPPVDKSMAIPQGSEESMVSGNVAPESKKMAEPQTAKTPARQLEGRATGSQATDQRKTQARETELSSLRREPSQAGRPNTAKKEEPAASLGHFEVVQNSFLRDKPASDAAITATLPPGTWVKIESRSGEYLRVRSLNDPGVLGYVHREDAFFARIR